MTDTPELLPCPNGCSSAGEVWNGEGLEACPVCHGDTVIPKAEPTDNLNRQMRRVIDAMGENLQLCREVRNSMKGVGVTDMTHTKEPTVDNGNHNFAGNPNGACAEIEGGLTDNGNLWRYWSEKAQTVASNHQAALAKARNDALEEAANKIKNLRQHLKFEELLMTLRDDERNTEIIKMVGDLFEANEAAIRALKSEGEG